MRKFIISVIATALIAGGGAFYAGARYAQSARGAAARLDFQNLSPEARSQRFRSGGANGNGLRGADSRGQNGGFVVGEIIAKDDKSVTVKLTDGGSKIIFLSDKTAITKSVSGARDDLGVGRNVAANGAPNADGSITAQSVQLR